MSYNFSLNRDAMQSQGLAPMSLIKQRSVNLNFDKQSLKSSVQTGQFNNNNHPGTTTIRASSRTSRRSLMMGFERVQRQIEKDVRKHTNNNNQLEETIKSNSFLNLFSLNRGSPTKDTGNMQISSKRSCKGLAQVIKQFREKNDADLEHIEVIDDVHKERPGCPSSGPGYFDRHKVKLAPRISKNKGNKSSSESIFNDKERAPVDLHGTQKKDIDKINN